MCLVILSNDNIIMVSRHGEKQLKEFKYAVVFREFKFEFKFNSRAYRICIKHNTILFIQLLSFVFISLIEVKTQKLIHCQIKSDQI